MRGLEDDDLYPILRSTGSDTRLLFLFLFLFLFSRKKPRVWKDQPGTSWSAKSYYNNLSCSFVVSISFKVLKFPPLLLNTSRSLAFNRQVAPLGSFSRESIVVAFVSSLVPRTRERREDNARVWKAWYELNWIELNWKLLETRGAISEDLALR